MLPPTDTKATAAWPGWVVLVEGGVVVVEAGVVVGTA